MTLSGSYKNKESGQACQFQGSVTVEGEKLESCPSRDGRKLAVVVTPQISVVVNAVVCPRHFHTVRLEDVLAGGLWSTLRQEFERIGQPIPPRSSLRLRLAPA